MPLENLDSSEKWEPLLQAKSRPYADSKDE